MTNEDEKKIMAALYDRLYDAITYQPSGAENPFKDKDTFIHFSKNAAIYPKSFCGQVTPSNPLGDLTAAEEFSSMVDRISPMALEWENSGSLLSAEYVNIVSGANALTEPDPKAKEQYMMAYDFLKPMITKTNRSTGKEVTVREDGPEFVAYEDNMDDYTSALICYRNAYNNYLNDKESSDPEVRKQADRKWQSDSLLFESKIKKAKRALTSGDAAEVKEAIDIMNTTINDGVRMAIENAREAVSDENWLTSSMMTGKKWLLSYPTPSNWADEGADNFTMLKLKGSNTTIRNSSSQDKFNVSSSLNAGIFHFSADASSEEERKHSTTNLDSVEISAEIAKVDIQRQWFNDAFFRINGWYNNYVPTVGSISNGKMDSTNKNNKIPMYPVSFIVARNIKIKADFSDEDKTFLSQNVDAKSSIGIGPFSISGGYSHGNQDESFESAIAGGEITVPGMQIIGWVSRLIPISPQVAAK